MRSSEYPEYLLIINSQLPYYLRCSDAHIVRDDLNGRHML